MSTADSPIAPFLPPPPASPSAVIEICVLLAGVGLGTLAFVLGWLTPEQAAVLTALLLVALLVLSWVRFDQGRHPCFLFLSALTLLQGGRLLAYCLGSEPNPLRVRLLTPFAFDLARDQAGLVLLCLALSAVCIYAPCRWFYTKIPTPLDLPGRKYLPYLYLIFCASLPAHAFKNYQYYEYAHEYGGYTLLFFNHADLAGAVPLLIRAVQTLTFPVFIAICVLERKRKALYVTTILYVASASVALLLGQRGGFFGLVLTLWYISRVKSGKKSRFLAIVALGAALVLVGDFVQHLREDAEATDYTFAPVEFAKLQGNSLDVTEVAIKYSRVFAPHAASYLWNELQDAFIARDATGYTRGLRLSHDVSVFLNPGEFSQGHGTAGSYLAEIYLLGGIAGVVAFSIMIGGGIHLMYSLSRRAWSLFFVAMIMPDVLLMPRGQVLDWLSVLLRYSLLVTVLYVGWLAFEFCTWLRAAPQVSR